MYKRQELILRQGIAIFLMEGTLFIISTYIRQLVTLVTWVYVDAIWQYIGIAFTLDVYKRQSLLVFHCAIAMVHGHWCIKKI